MPHPESFSDDDLIVLLNDLIQLDHDAIEGYTVAINTIRNHGHREALATFRHDHARHVEALGALVRAHGGVPARVSHIGGPLGGAVQALGSASASDASVLLAFRAIERQARDRYFGSASEAYPDDVRPVLRRHASDEENHYRWFVSRLEDLGFERELSDVPLDRSSVSTRSREHAPAQYRPESDAQEPMA